MPLHATVQKTTDFFLPENRRLCDARDRGQGHSTRVWPRGCREQRLTSVLCTMCVLTVSSLCVRFLFLSYASRRRMIFVSGSGAYFPVLLLILLYHVALISPVISIVLPHLCEYCAYITNNIFMERSTTFRDVHWKSPVLQSSANEIASTWAGVSRRRDSCISSGREKSKRVCGFRSYSQAANCSWVYGQTVRAAGSCAGFPLTPLALMVKRARLVCVPSTVVLFS